MATLCDEGEADPCDEFAVEASSLCRSDQRFPNPEALPAPIKNVGAVEAPGVDAPSAGSKNRLIEQTTRANASRSPCRRGRSCG